ncbi:TniQ family protein [Streptomyces sp. NPDC093085]|uniref:TniQ family protein n=1 Tax=Streptomyces sp. NPDC093085 TaxID=3155068 RepID=UPI00342E0E0F
MLAQVPDSLRLRPGAPRRLPAVPVPGRRESLPSWMNRLCLAYEVRGPDIIPALGLSTRGEMRPTTAGLALSTPSIEALGAATGFSERAIGKMLLSRFTATALPNLPRPPYGRPGALMSWAAGAWALRRHSNFCPRCLARDGRWRLEWKLPWSFACLEHVIYLCNRCPRCGRVQSGLCWGRDSRECRLTRPASDAAASLRDGLPLRNGPNAVCRGRLDEAAVVPVTDARAVEGQERLMRWLYGAADESAREEEFGPLTALAAQCLSPEMLRRAQPELRPVLPLDGDAWPRTQPELSPLWTDPLWMAAAAHVAQRLSATRYRPERSVLWLNLRQPCPAHPWKRLYWRNPALHGTALVFGAFHHDTEHMREALRTGLVALPYQGPAYINTLSPYRVHPAAGSKVLPYPQRSE